MALPTRDDMLSHVEFRFRELAPEAPTFLDPDDPAQATMIQQWHQAHHEVLSKMTDEALFSYFPHAPRQLDPSNSDHTDLIAYWKDIASQIDSGQPGRYDWSNTTPSGVSASASQPESESESEEIEMPIQDGSVYLESRIEGVIVVMEAFADAVSARPPLGAEIAIHTAKQIEALRVLVKDGTFQTYDHWWRSPSYSKTIYDEDDKNEEIAFVRDLTLEAKIDRSDGSLDLHLAGWATDFKRHDSFGRVSMAGG